MTTRLAGDKAWLPYVLPFGLYLAFLGLQGRFSPDSLVWLYPLKTLVVAGALLAFRKSYVELRPSFSLLAVAVGALAIGIWIAIDPFYPGLSRLLGSDSPTPFDPTSIASPGARLTFLVFRVLGAVLVVPLMEELFWRGFLARWLVKDDFQSVPVGTFTPFAFGATVVLFGLEHEQWLAGLICGALYNGLLYRTKSLTDCVVAHATSNALLAAWVLTRGDFKFW
ncbi:MAG TPA: CAAX prenyl protease-related protein [Vicinamibacteria bacterium]